MELSKDNKNYYRVNWIDGMKINKNRFIDSENAFVKYTQLSSSRGITSTNYGLLPYWTSENSLELSFSMDGQNTIVVSITNCNAITIGGHLIHITPEISAYLKNEGRLISTDYKIKDTVEDHFIVLSVNPYARIPVGDADPQEEPPRHPFVLPEYTLSIVPKNEVNEKGFGQYHLTIGRIIFENNIPKLDNDFVPPCTSIQSNERLIRAYQATSTFFNDLEKDTLEIIQKIYQKKQTNDLAKMIQTLCNNTLLYIGSILSEHRAHDKNATPQAIIIKSMSLARVIQNSLNTYVGTGKEQLINYLSEWCNVSQGAFEDAISEMIELEYNHTDINASLETMGSFISLISSLFKKLNELDLIGKKSDSNIFVKEEVLDKKETKSKRSFLFD